MKQLAMYLVSIVALTACAVDSPDPTESSAPQELRTDPETNLRGTCSTRSGSPCAGAAINSVCGFGPARWCLPSNELPDGGILCLCQQQSTI